MKKPVFFRKNTTFNYIDLIWQAANKFLTYFFFISLCQCFLYNFIWLYLKAPVPWFPALGIVFVNLSYGFIITYIFYLMTIVLPLVKKKVKLFAYVNNKVVYIDLEVRGVFESLGLESFERNPDFNQKLYNKLASIKLHEKTVRTHADSLVFADFSQYLLYKLNRVKALIHELLMVQDILTIDAMKYLSRLDNAIYNLSRHPYNLMQNVTGTYIYIDLVKLPFYSHRIFHAAHLRAVPFSWLSSIEYDKEERKHDTETISIYNSQKNKSIQ